MGKRWKVILFDLDNTFYSNEHSWAKGVQYALKKLEYHKNVNVEDFFARFKMVSEELWGLFENRNLSLTEYRRKRYRDTASIFGIHASDEEADHFHQVFAGKTMDFVEPFPGLRETLDYIHQRYTVGIVTNGPHDHQYIKLEKLAVHDIFGKHNVFNSGEIGVAKPDKGIFTHALNRLGFEARETLFVGDSWEADVVGAIDSGMEVIWLNSLNRKPATDHQPLAVIQSFDHLLPLLKQLDK